MRSFYLPNGVLPRRAAEVEPLPHLLRLEAVHDPQHPAERPVGEEVPERDAREGGTLDALAQVVLVELWQLAN